MRPSVVTLSLSKGRRTLCAAWFARLDASAVVRYLTMTGTRRTFVRRRFDRLSVTMLGIALLAFSAPVTAATPVPAIPSPKAAKPSAKTPAPKTVAPKSSQPPGGAASGAGAGFSFADWQVSTGQLDANWASGAFSTPGHIVLTRPGSSIEADHANGNFKSHTAVLNGGVVLHDSNGVLTGFAGQGPSKTPATLTCDNLNIDGTAKTYVATGNVHFMQGGRAVKADRAVMNGLTHDIHLYGNVQLIQ